jgi:hypothetical protein
VRRWPWGDEVEPLDPGASLDGDAWPDLAVLLLPGVVLLFRLVESAGSPRLGALLCRVEGSVLVAVSGSPLLGAWLCRVEGAVLVAVSGSPLLGAWLCRVEGAVRTGEWATLPRRDVDCSGDADPLGAADARDDFMVILVSANFPSQVCQQCKSYINIVVPCVLCRVGII